MPILPVRLGKDPYGFMGKFQGISGSGGTHQIVESVFQYLFSNEKFRNFAIESFITALTNSGSFYRSNDLSKYFPEIDRLSLEQEEKLVQVFNSNKQVYGAFDIRDCIVESLKRTTGNDYELGTYRLTRIGDPEMI